jgi:hypothetical protein
VLEEVELEKLSLTSKRVSILVEYEKLRAQEKSRTGNLSFALMAIVSTTYRKVALRCRINARVF